MNRSVILLAMLGAACDVARKEETRASTDSIPTDTMRANGSVEQIVQRWQAQVPDSVLLRRGACPFECCMYSDWALRDSAAIVREPRKNAPRLFMMPDSQRFHADSGFVRISRVALVVVHDTVSEMVNQGPARQFLPGDTLVVLDYIGEGHWNVWSKGRVYEVEGFWGAEVMPIISELIGNYEREWWAHITTLDGRTGWLLIEPPMQLIGADKCGGPPPWVRDSAPRE